MKNDLESCILGITYIQQSGNDSAMTFSAGPVHRLWSLSAEAGQIDRYIIPNEQFHQWQIPVQSSPVSRRVTPSVSDTQCFGPAIDQNFLDSIYITVDKIYHHFVMNLVTYKCR